MEMGGLLLRWILNVKVSECEGNRMFGFQYQTVN
jgi:hypothetical protein